MVLDPLTALSVATSVIQFVDFGAKLISKGKEIYKSADGVLADHAEQAAISAKLADLTRALSGSIDVSAITRELSPAENALQEVALDCREVAEDFTLAIDELRVTGNHRKWKSFRQALKSVWKKEGIEERLQRLDRLRQLVTVHLLVVVNDHQRTAFTNITSEINGMEVKLRDGVCQGINEIKQQVQGLSENLSRLAQEQSKNIHDDWSKKMEARQKLVEKWRRQNEEKLNRILQSVRQKDEDDKRLTYRRKVLDSLYFEKIDDRHIMIDAKHQATLEWVFNPPPEIQSQWSNIPAWLQGSDGLYWVSGKAGSGKSTLLKWLLQEDRTTKLLESWSRGKLLLTAHYFFWSSGSDVQKSLSGLLRSLLYELLQQWPDLIAQISPPRWRSYDLELAHFPAWTNVDLLTAFQTLLRHAVQDARVCLFIDGLDEFAGDDDQRIEILNLLKELAAYPHIKICVSSRPWELFKDAFADCPNIRLEYLTRKDIEAYINAKLQANDKFEALRQEYPDLCSQLVREIIEKAKGVWLWVIVVVRSLLRGLRNRDTVSDLLDRLRQIPEELEKYFLQMFDNIESFYRQKALKLLKLALNSPRGLSLMTCSFLDEENLRFPFETPMKAVAEKEIIQRLELTDGRVNVLCLDLLETVSRNPSRHLFYRHSVEFLHRTARDFLLDANMQKQVNMESVSSFDVNLFMCKALLAQIKMTGTPSKQLLADFMHNAAQLEEESSQSLLPLLEHLNQVLESQRHKAWSNDSLSNCPVKTWSCADQGPIPLLSLAIQYGLVRYVKTNLISTPALVAKQPGRPLLDFALRRRIHSVVDGQAEQMDHPVGGAHDQPDIELVRLILDRGGDPNGKCGSSTVWKLFMGFFDVVGQDLQRLDEKGRQAWIEVTELLIGYGAVRVLERETIILIPRQSSGRTRVKLSYRQVLARSSIAAAFGEAEAARLDSLSWWLNATGQNLLTNIIRNVGSLFAQPT
ncbi:Valine--tRNA ligase [Talaromyces islandicus]|uniref:Valine--tRNA ligase n=1 Tax=Talaromyces islandicus TaxID=28573 RepID=A0A0U1M553_TALIS|nr:Valine--tRNA ligase [Talaromyces islandicus]